MTVVPTVTKRAPSRSRLPHAQSEFLSHAPSLAHASPEQGRAAHEARLFLRELLQTIVFAFLLSAPIALLETCR